MAAHGINAGLVITVAQTAVDFLWSHWDGSSKSVRSALLASEFWTMQAFSLHGPWVQSVTRDALVEFLGNYIDRRLDVGQSEDLAVATAVYRLTGQRVGAA